jgi:hypothetical protein
LAVAVCELSRLSAKFDALATEVFGAADRGGVAQAQGGVKDFV